ncbi:uncharacterized protein CXorf38 homolog [Phyllobates terribilis]|uniref:uncharacterized protein CXorf38 homolog n=1 Tax=Phyllobates terribilis TaxID=111132 RepID=UPI003CCB552C
MALHGLFARLNCREYKNWMKAGHCLLLLQSRLQGYIDKEMQAFHQQLANRVTAPRQWICQCRAKGKQFKPSCPVCAQWKQIILAHHKNRNGVIHWGNSDPSLWSTHYWEVAKVYMPHGQTHFSGPQQCDAAALLNLINNCDHFRVSNISRVREVIKCRNELFHSSDMKVSSSWLKTFGQKVHNLVAEFTHVPGLVRDGEKMQEVLLSDWNVEDSGIYEVDGVHFTPQSKPTSRLAPSSTNDTSLSPNMVERIMIQQLIQELYLDIEEHGSLTKKEIEKIRNMKAFLAQNEDLQMVFQEDITNLDSLCKEHIAISEEGWIHTRRAAMFFVVVLAFLTAYFLVQED